jgi:hypothetical protein
MTASPARALHGLDLEFRPRDYQFRPSDEGRPPTRAGLPPCLPGEVEIALIAVGTVDADVYSVRARRAGGRFVYRITDPYFTPWQVRSRSSTRRLTLGELIGLIDTARPQGWQPSPESLGDLWRERLASTRGDDAAAVAVHVTSAIYPGIEGYYRRQAGLWLEARPGHDAEAEAA